MAYTYTIDNIQDALTALGVMDTTLNAAQKKALDEQGFLILPGLLDRGQLAELRETFDRLVAEPRDPDTTRQESGTRHIGNLVNQGRPFERLYTEPKVLAAVYHVTGQEFRLAQVAGRDPLPGFGQQGLHADWPARQPHEPFQAVNSIWLLDDFTAANGATRLVPGTHRLTTRPPKAVLQPTYTHADQISAVGSAGSVLVFNAHLWHSGMVNRSAGSRRSINCFYTPRISLYQGQSDVIGPSVLADLSPAVRYLLDV